MHELDGDRFAHARAHIAEIRRIATARFDAAGNRTVERALEWALYCHLEQRDRPDGAPYVEHVTSVAARVLGWSTAPSPELCAAALLHDSLEDQEVRLAARADGPGDPSTQARAAIAVTFGPRVRAMLETLTNPDFDRIAREHHGCRPGSAAEAAVKRALYGLHFVEIFVTDRETALIKLADFSDNALKLDGLAGTNPAQYARLTRKYGPCVSFLIDELEALDDPRDPLFPVREPALASLRDAWTRFYASPR